MLAVVHTQTARVQRIETNWQPSWRHKKEGVKIIVRPAGNTAGHLSSV